MNYLLIIIVCLLAAIGWFKPEKTPEWLRVIVFVLLLALLATQLFEEEKRVEREDATKFTGLLSPKSSRLNQPPKKKRLDIGWTFDWTAWSFYFDQGLSELFINAKSGNRRFFRALEDMNFEYDFTSEQLLVSMVVRDSKGAIIGSIEQNEWKVAPPPKTYDRNYSRDMLEIIDDKGRVVLQVRALPDAIQLNGVFYAENGYGVEIFPVPNNGRRRAGMRMLAPDSPPQNNMPRIFKYPSERHLGEFSTFATRK